MNNFLGKKTKPNQKPFSWTKPLIAGCAVLYPQCSPSLQPLWDLVISTCFPPGDTDILDFVGQQKGNDVAGSPRQLLPLPPISNVAAAGLHSLRYFTK